MALSKYNVYHENVGDKVWWVGNYDVVGEFLFTFDKKKVYSLFRDYPFKLSVEEWMTFNAENAYWEKFFEDRNAKYKSEHYEEIANYIDEHKG